MLPDIIPFQELRQQIAKTDGTEEIANNDGQPNHGFPPPFSNSTLFLSKQDTQRCPLETERFPQLIFQISKVTKVNQVRIVDKQYKHRRFDRYLGSILYGTFSSF